MTKVNVKAKESNVVGVGYSFTVNEDSQTFYYLNENKVKNYLERKANYFMNKRESDDLNYNEQQGHFAMGMSAATLPVVSNMLTHQMAVVTATGTIKQIGLMKALLPIVHLIQGFALPLSIAVACWGCIEYIMGTPGWKHKLRGAIIGLIAIYVVPFGFMAISDALSSL